MSVNLDVLNLNFPPLFYSKSKSLFKGTKHDWVRVSPDSAPLTNTHHSSLAWIRDAICLLALALIGACEPWNQTPNPYSINTTNRFGAGLGLQLAGCCDIRSPTACPQWTAIGWPGCSQFKAVLNLAANQLFVFADVTMCSISSLKMFRFCW